MKKVSPFLFLPVIFSFFSIPKENPNPVPYIIPDQKFDILAEMGFEKLNDTITAHSFEISPQILFWEYKKYLSQIKKDSSEIFYRSQLPDSTMALKENYEEYLKNPVYDTFPVVGVSWDNAMNYLRWRTIEANTDGVYDTIYRLPMLSEWVAANRYFKTVDVLKNEMNCNYSDWTLNSKDETTYDFVNKFKFDDFCYFAKPNDDNVLKRKMAIGNSYHFSQQNLYEFETWGYYEFHGYAHISFRYVIDVLSQKQMENQKKYGVLKLWGLNQ